MNTWIDLPIIAAFEYFQSLLGWFLGFARRYGTLIGLIGLCWTAFRLINSRIDMKTMWWDTIYKWLIYIILINCYVTVTSGVSLLANKVALEAGNGKDTIVENFKNLKEAIEKDIAAFREWTEENSDLVYRETGIHIEPLADGESEKDYIKRMHESVKPPFFGYDQQKSKATAIMTQRMSERSEHENSVFGEQTLRALNEVLIVTDPEGNPTEDLTNAYVDIDIWMKDQGGRNTYFLSPSVILRVGLLSSQVFWEKSQIDLVEYEDKLREDGQNAFQRTMNLTVTNVVNMILAGISCLAIIVSVVFAIIQYAMCTIEFIIIQSIGAFFIPFYLFDGTKDLPKKLVPVFTGLFIKIIVMIVCLLFIIYLWLDFASQMTDPVSGGINWVAVTNVLFTSLLSFILTSNAPKIAMTLLTGQPQLSMGEFMAAAGTMVGGAIAAKNLGGWVTSPARKNMAAKINRFNERRAASKAAIRKYEQQNGAEFASVMSSIDQSTLSGRNQAKYTQERYETAKRQAGAEAYAAVMEQQRQNYDRNGGAFGEAGRMIAHYGGGAMNPVQTLKSGREYQVAGSGIIDLNKISEESVAANRYGIRPEPNRIG